MNQLRKKYAESLGHLVAWEEKWAESLNPPENGKPQRRMVVREEGHAQKKGIKLSPEDDDLSRFNWLFYPKQKYPYPFAGFFFDGQKLQVHLHRIVMFRVHGMELVGKVSDHINHDPLDNRRENLRAVTTSQNMGNMKNAARSECGFRGVTKAGGKWAACIQINRKRVWLGNFETPELAALAYDDRAKQVGFLHINFPKL